MKAFRAVFQLVSVLSIGSLVVRGELIRDGSFESPTSAGKPASPRSSMKYVPSGSPWTFNGGSGVQLADERDVHMYVPGNRAPDGRWVAFLQGEAASIQQPFATAVAGKYRLQYYMAGRDQDPPFGGDTRYEVRINGKRIALQASASHQPWTLRSLDFAVPAGTNDLEFVVVHPLRTADSRFAGAAFFLDAVSIMPLDSGVVAQGVPGLTAAANGPVDVPAQTGPSSGGSGSASEIPALSGSVRSVIGPTSNLPPVSRVPSVGRSRLNWLLLLAALILGAILILTLPALLRRRQQ
jgi:hypothetical protein